MGATTLYFKKRQPEPEQQTKGEDEMFAKVAKEKYRLWFPVISEHIKLLVKKTPDTIVDVACGPGFLVKALGETFAKSRIVGIDRSRKALAFAKQTNTGKKNILIRLGSAYELPFADGSVDVVTCRDSLHHFGEPIRALKEMARILRPGGLLYVQDLRRDVPWYLLQPSLAGDTIFQRLQVMSVRAAYTKAELKALCVKAGILSPHICTRTVRVAGQRARMLSIADQGQLRSSFQAHMVLVWNKK